ncbi:MAG: Gfo/Idh/MocA family oxidoreductase [Candidatus Anammoximicrobium sp.]|nr:Gfo/Idh/MocA family oxidoreductase [Candidatus Anammoximicrobium sp.]
MKRTNDRSDRRGGRRKFLKTCGLAAAAWTAPAFVPSSVFGARAPSERIGVAVIGNGNQATIDIPAFLQNDDVQVVAVCDVNTASGGYKTPQQFLGRKPAQEQVNKYYADKTGRGQYQGCAAYRDFREVLARSDVDAVVIVVPDHWHAVMAVAAARAGKDIYCEKPLSLTVAEGQAMVQAVRRHGRILQTGSHWRSHPWVRHACELVRNGRIGKLERILVTLPPNNAVSPGPGWQPMPVPPGFDYDMWLGPAPQAEYHRDRCFYRFRFILDYSGGQVTNFGAHRHDIAQWGHGTELTGPVEVEDLGGEFPPPGDLFTTALKVAFRCRFADGVELVCRTENPDSPTRFETRFEGTEGWVQFARNGVKTQPESLADSQIGPDEIHLPVSNPARSGKEKRINYLIPDHVRNFLDAVRSRQDPIEPVEVGHRTATICHLGNLAMLLKRKIRWDPDKEQVVGDDQAAAVLARPLRPPWHL